MPKFPLFGRFGFGFDITTGQFMDPVVVFHYSGGKTFEFRGQRYDVPDEILIDPSPSSTELEDSLVSVYREIRDYQTGLAQEVGVKGPIKAGVDGEFARDAQVTAANQKFNAGLALMSRITGSYTYFAVRTTGNIKASDAFLQLVAECRDGGGSYDDVFATYGTHFASRAGVGGRMDFLTTINADAISNSSATDLSLQAQASIEFRGITVDSDTSFEHRSAQLQQTYRENTSRSVVLMGGDVTVDTLGEWKHSLDDSVLPSEGYAQPLAYTRRVKLRVREDQRILNMDVNELRPISDLCPQFDREAVAAALVAYIRQFGLASRRKQRMPLIAGAEDAAKFTLTPGAKCEFGGWLFADNDIEVGLQAEPGAQGKIVISHSMHSDIKQELQAGQVASWSEYFGAGKIGLQFESDSPSAVLHVREW